MQCPRCGAQNAPDVTACVRCGLPAYSSQPATRPAPPPSLQAPANPASSGWGGYSQTQNMGLDRFTIKEYVTPLVVKLAMITAVVAAVVCLAYGAFAVIWRRGVYADLADNAGSVSADDASRSDLVNGILLWPAIVLAAIAVALWLASFITARHGRTLLGQIGLAVVLLGAAGGIFGGISVSEVSTASDAGEGATGYIVAGLGFAVLAAGLIVGVVALGKQPPEETTAELSYGGNPTFSGAAPQPGYAPQQMPQQPGQTPGGPTW